MVHIISVDATLSGSGVKQKEKDVFSNTHMHTDCILITLFPACVSFFLYEPYLKELMSQFKQTY